MYDIYEVKETRPEILPSVSIPHVTVTNAATKKGPRTAPLTIHPSCNGHPH